MSDLNSLIKTSISSQVKKTFSTSNVEIKNNQLEKKQIINTTTKVVLGTGLGALAAVGIYIATRGKKTPKVSIPLSDAIKAPEVDIPNIPEILQKTVDEFKAAGKFVRGKAVTNTGENFSGQLTKELKDGTKTVMEYKDGILQASTKFKGEEKVFEKAYTFNESGILTGIAKDGKNVFEKTIYKNGDIGIKGNRKIYIAHDQYGKKFAVHKLGNAGKAEKDMYYFFKPDGKTVDFAAGADDFMYYRDKNGSLYDHTELGYQIDAMRDTDRGKELYLISPSIRFWDKAWRKQSPDITAKYEKKHGYDGIDTLHDMADDRIMNTTKSYNGGEYGDNFDNTLSIRKQLFKKRDGSIEKIYRVNSAASGAVYIKKHNSDVIELFLENGRKSIGQYNTKTKEFIGLEGMSEEKALSFLDEMNIATKKLKENVIDLYKLKRRNDVFERLQAAKKENGFW